MATMALRAEILLILLGSVEIFCKQSQSQTQTYQPLFKCSVDEIFLSEKFNSSDLEWILRSARQSFQCLKTVEKAKESSPKVVRFVLSYTNLLSRILNKIFANKISAFQIFAQENSFLKEYDKHFTIDYYEETNATELKAKLLDIQYFIEKCLMPCLTSINHREDLSKILSMNETSFNAFLEEKLKKDFDFGYFILDTFSALIDASWELISIILFYSDLNLDMS